MKIVRTYATSANLGPGFDCLGICFDIYNEYAFEKSDSYELLGFDSDFLDPKNNLIITSYEKVFSIKNKKLEYIKLTEVVKNIPNSRGLGSSASCIVVGILIANDILNNILDKDEIFQIASSIEGHPDNVAPLIFGGFTCSFMDDKYYTVKLDVNDKLKFKVLIPSFELKTSVARSALPKNIQIKDAVFNISHAIGMIKGIEKGDMDLIKVSKKDVLHEPYRYPLIKGSSDVINLAKEKNAVCMISGAGSTLLVISDKEIDITYQDWKVVDVNISNIGAYIYER